LIKTIANFQLPTANCLAGRDQPRSLPCQTIGNWKCAMGNADFISSTLIEPIANFQLRIAHCLPGRHQGYRLSPPDGWQLEMRNGQCGLYFIAAVLERISIAYIGSTGTLPF